ncbi:MAG: hypothetical protein HC808_12225 [Candidatus Competibacteraceae bacterium]|nr:hypothetical protein [Candidatus Competibacteraceae bacterium]
MLLAMACGCSSLLPTVEETTESPWKSYADTKNSFDKIQPGQTTREDMKALGFDPFENPNIRLIDYLEITQRFLPNQSITLQDLHPAMRTCLEAKTSCRGYEITPRMVRSKRYGNAVLDVFNFRRKTRKTGWSFSGLIILNGDLAVFKLEGGEPKILELEDKKNPLGPFQDISVSPDIGL